MVSPQTEKATAAVLETPRCHDTMKGRFMMQDYSNLPLLSLQPETKEIPLTRGQVAIVDAADYEWLMQWKWHAHRAKSTWYAERTVNHTNKIKMHRIICGVTNPEIVIDHIDGNGLNNSRDNLRVASAKQNSRNQQRRAKKSSGGFTGVGFHKATGKFVAYIRVDGKFIHLGLFSDPREAAIVRDQAAVKYHGEFASLNFPAEE